MSKTYKPTEFGVRAGDVQTAVTYLFLLEWGADLRERRVIDLHPEMAKWWDEFRLMNEERTFCAALLGDEAYEVRNVWEDARVERAARAVLGSLS